MNVEIIDKPFILGIYGLTGTVQNNYYSGAAFSLSGKMWQIVKSNLLKNKGINVWVYEPDKKIFTGVELDETPGEDLGLEHKTISLQKYAYYKHIGSYNLIKRVGQSMTDNLNQRGFATDLPYIEIYGH